MREGALKFNVTFPSGEDTEDNLIGAHWRGRMLVLQTQRTKMIKSS
jgi:hypothetical protein